MIMGDFNIYSDNEDMIAVLNDNGFLELEALKGEPTNASGTQSYDKIFYHKNPYFNIAHPDGNNGGVFRFFETIYRDNDYRSYKKHMREHKDDPSTTH